MNTAPDPASSPAQHRHIFRTGHSAAILGSAVVFIGLCALYWQFVADDAYIVGRYARNAAAGHGLVYNIGEHVSALTSPLHALLESLLAFLGLAPVTSYRLIAPFLVLAGWYVALRETDIRGSTFYLFTALSLFSPFLALWSIGGLETPLLACLATVFISRLSVMKRAGIAQNRDFIVLGGAAGLMFLTRYDSVLVTAPILLAITVIEFRRSALWWGALLCLILASSWLIFAIWYFGDIFPTSYYLKFALGGRAPIDSLSALLNFGAVSGLFVLVFFLRFPSLAQQTPLSKAILRGAAFSAILFLLYASRASGQHMMFGYRLFVPYLMGVALIASLAIAKPRPALSALFIGWQAVLATVVAFIGVNPAPLTHLPGLNKAYAEYEFITPAVYGQFMDMLRDDAREIEAHWQNTGTQDQPRIYLRTGGTGYWLPDFYVYEALVSYRHDCGVPTRKMIEASHYMQQLGFSKMGTIIEDIGRARSDISVDAPLLFQTTLDWMGPEITGYLYGADPAPRRESPLISAGCIVP